MLGLGLLQTDRSERLKNVSGTKVDLHTRLTKLMKYDNVYFNSFGRKFIPGQS